MALKGKLIRLLNFGTKPTKNKILVGTHHKTGSVWMTNVFRSIAEQFDLKFQRVSSTTPVAPEGEWDIFFNSHSQFILDDLANFRGLHIIRDPRDQVISAAFYHCRSQESWLHEKVDEFGGLTYQEKINSYQSDDDKILFEMEHSSNTVLSRILKFDFEDKRFRHTRYEDLIDDIELREFERIFKFLGFADYTLPICRECAYAKSLFSGNVQSSKHVRSGSSKQWPKHFKSIHREKFDQLFPGIISKLGYDEDEEWLKI